MQIKLAHHFLSFVFALPSKKYVLKNIADKDHTVVFICDIPIGPYKNCVARAIRSGANKVSEQQWVGMHPLWAV